MITKRCFHSLIPCGFLALALIPIGVAQQPLAGQEVSRWIDEQTVALVRIDVESLLSSFSPEKVQRLLDQAGLQPDQTAPVLAIGQHVNELGQQLLQAGGAEIWLVLSLADVPRGSPLIVVRGSTDRDASQLMPWLEAHRAALGSESFQVKKHDELTCLVALPETLQRASRLAPDERSELAPALAAAGKGPVCAVLILSRDQRRVIRETLPSFPRPGRR